jgi:serine/threonine-protein kinase
MQPHAPKHEDLMSAPELPRDTLLAGKFRIERVLGQGAFGAVYAIRHELTRHRRALKLLHAQHRNDATVVQRFLNEASAAGRAGSPHLVEIFDAGTLETGEPYLVMELLDGETLGSMLSRCGPLAAGVAAQLVAQAAEGVAAAHRAGIIHRDLKPENLFVTQRENAAFVKLLDFGVSKFATDSGAGLHSTRGGACGTPFYMAPEQLQADRTLDARADVFALGVVLFECLTGEGPFEAASLEALAFQLVYGQPKRVESLRPDLPAELAAVVHRAIAQDRERRYPSARAFAQALAPFARRGDEPVQEVAAMARTLPSSYPPALGPELDDWAEGLGPRQPGRGMGRRRACAVAGALLACAFGAWSLTRHFTANSAGAARAVSASSPNRVVSPVRPTDATLGGSTTPPLPASDVPAAPARSVVPSLRRGVDSAAPLPTSAPRPTRARELGLAEENPYQ